MSERVPGIALLLARLYVGYWFIATGLTKIGRGYFQGGALLPQLERFVAGTSHAWYMVGNYLFAKGWTSPAASHDKDFLILLLVVLISGAGRYWGIDGWLRRRR